MIRAFSPVRGGILKLRAVLLLPLALLLLGLGGCGKNTPAAGDAAMTYQQISQTEAKTLMDSESDYQIVDVRTEEEFATGHIPGAICLPNESIDPAAPETTAAALPDKDRLLLVYCRSGNRSRQAAQKLAELGYTDVREFGGISTWPYDIEP